MSHALHIWADPLPTSLADAQATVARLSGGKAAANATTAKPETEPAAFAHLRKALARALADDPALAGKVFYGLGSGLPNHPPPQMLTVGVPAPFTAELVPLLVAEALALALAVYDEQAGVAYHPFRHQLTPEGEVPIRPADLQPRPLKPAGVWLAARPQPEELGPDEAARAWIAKRRRLPEFQAALLDKGATRADWPEGAEPCDRLWMQARVLRHFGPWFTAQGFIERSDSAETTEFARLTEGGIQSWALRPFLSASNANGSGPGFGVRCNIRPWLPDLLAGEGTSFPLVPPPHDPDTWGRARPRDENLALARTRAELEQVLAAFRPSLDTGLLPLLEACRTPQGTLKLARQTGGPNPLRPTAALLKLAHWEGAPDHAALCRLLQQRHRASGGNPGNFVWPACRLRALPEAFGTLRPQAL